MRRTRLKQGTKRMKRRIPKKTDAQKLWEQQQCFCFVCGYTSFRGWNLETHHIVRRRRSIAGKHDSANWLRVCNGLAFGCHERIDGAPLPVVLALKKIADEETYSLERLVELHGSAPGFVTQAEVDEVIARLRREGFEDATPERAIELVAAEIRRGQNA